MIHKSFQTTNCSAHLGHLGRQRDERPQHHCAVGAALLHLHVLGPAQGVVAVEVRALSDTTPIPFHLCLPWVGWLAHRTRSWRRWKPTGSRSWMGRMMRRWNLWEVCIAQVVRPNERVK